MNQTELINYIICPQCGSENLTKNINTFKCLDCRSEYPIKNNILILIRPRNQFSILSTWNSEGEFAELHKKRLAFNKKQLATSPRVVMLIKKFTNNKTMTLDVGCGSGLYTEKFKGSVISFDIVPYFVKEAAKKLSGPKRIFIIADANDFPFKKNLFDLVFASQVIEHFDEKSSDKIIKKMIQVSKKLVLIDTPNDGNAFLRVGKKILYFGKSHHKQDYHLDHHRTLGKKDLEKHNFKTYSCIGFVTRRRIPLKVLWDIYDIFAWRIPGLGGNLIGILKKNTSNY